MRTLRTRRAGASTRAADLYAVDEPPRRCRPRRERARRSAARRRRRGRRRGQARRPLSRSMLASSRASEQRVAERQHDHRACRAAIESVTAAAALTACRPSTVGCGRSAPPTALSHVHPGELDPGAPRGAGELCGRARRGAPASTSDRQTYELEPSCSSTPSSATSRDPQRAEPPCCSSSASTATRAASRPSSGDRRALAMRSPRSAPCAPRAVGTGSWRRAGAAARRAVSSLSDRGAHEGHFATSNRRASPSVDPRLEDATAGLTPDASSPVRLGRFVDGPRSATTSSLYAACSSRGAPAACRRRQRARTGRLGRRLDRAGRPRRRERARPRRALEADASPCATVSAVGDVVAHPAPGPSRPCRALAARRCRSWRRPCWRSGTAC